MERRKIFWRGDRIEWLLWAGQHEWFAQEWYRSTKGTTMTMWMARGDAGRLYEEVKIGHHVIAYNLATGQLTYVGAVSEGQRSFLESHHGNVLRMANREKRRWK